MLIFLIVALIIIVLIFGIVSGMQSYASAKQAEAAIEMAKANQVSSAGNFTAILTSLFVVLFVMAILIGLIYLYLKFRKTMTAVQRGQRGRLPHQSSGMEVLDAGDRSAQIDSATINQLMQLEMLKYLRSLNPASNQKQLAEPEENQNDGFYL
jgi:uncharacterized protein HemY